MTKGEIKVIDRAIEIAVREHSGQIDKSGMPYILHPMRVMWGVSNYGVKAMAVAILHDVVEDCDITIEDLRVEPLFDTDIIDAIDALTKRTGEKYENYLARVKEFPISVAVKQTDIKDNTLPERLKKLPTEEQRYLLNKYAKALTLL